MHKTVCITGHDTRSHTNLDSLSVLKRVYHFTLFGGQRSTELFLSHFLRHANSCLPFGRFKTARAEKSRLAFGDSVNETAIGKKITRDNRPSHVYESLVGDNKLTKFYLYKCTNKNRILNKVQAIISGHAQTSAQTVRTQF